jgi:large subunit ribosomal protein L29
LSSTRRRGLAAEPWVPPRLERLIYLRARELRDLSDEELVRRLAESRENLFNLRFQMATGALENSARIGLAKRDIARILTIQAERANTLERR